MAEHILIELAAIVVLGVAAQWLAWRLRLPAILLLLLTGLAVGPGTLWLSSQGWIFKDRFLAPNKLFGELLLPAVSLSVALILFEGGLTLNLRELRKVGLVIWRLVTVGALVTWVLSAVAAHYVIGLDLPLSVLLGAVLTVTGPTVIGPLLRHVRPVGPVGPVLKWEGIVIDPIGAMLAVVVFEVIATGPMKPSAIGWIALKTIVIGTGMGLVTAAALIVMLKRRMVPDQLHPAMALAMVFIAFTGANLAQHESGLFAVTVLGIVVANQRYVSVHHIMEFKEHLAVLLIAMLFIVLGARLQDSQLRAALSINAVAFVLVLIVIVRPLAVAICTARSKLAIQERIFIAGIAPRGMVAAAVTSVFALRLTETGYPGADQLVPVMFAVIFGTVTVYGLGARWLAKRLGLSKPNKLGFLIAGAGDLARQVGVLLQREGFEVLLADTSREHVRRARLEGLTAMDASILSNDVEESVELTSIGRLLAMTPNPEVNALAVQQYGRIFGRDQVYQLAPPAPKTPRKDHGDGVHGRILFGKEMTHDALAARLAGGAVLKRTPLTKEFDYGHFRARYGDGAIPLFTLSKESGAVTLFTAESSPAPRPGQIVITLAPADAPLPVSAAPGG